MESCFFGSTKNQNMNRMNVASFLSFLCSPILKTDTCLGWYIFSNMGMLGSELPGMTGAVGRSPRWGPSGERLVSRGVQKPRKLWSRNFQLSQLTPTSCPTWSCSMNGCSSANYLSCFRFYRLSVLLQPATEGCSCRAAWCIWQVPGQVTGKQGSRHVCATCQIRDGWPFSQEKCISFYKFVDSKFPSLAGVSGS